MNSTAMAILFCGLTYLLVHDGDNMARKSIELCIVIVGLWMMTLLCAFIWAVLGD